MIHVSAGEPAPLLLIIPTASLTVTATIRRLADDLFWNPTTETWEVTPENLPTVEIEAGVYKLVLPDNVLMGSYLVQYNDGADLHYQQVYAGGFKYNSELNTCIVYGTIKDANGRPVSATPVIIEPIPTLSFIGGTALGMSAKTTYTDENGGFAIEAVREAQVVIIVNEVGFRKRVDIPDAASIPLESL